VALEHLDLENWSCPLPLRNHDRVVIGHGGGGKLSAELVEHLFLPAFRRDDGEPSAEMHDAATLVLSASGAHGGGRLAFSTDSYVVRPLFFPGGCIGDLAVHGTINDVSMSGAVPIALSAGFIIKEGLPLATLGAIAERMGDAARSAGVPIVTGDTKVVDAGLADGVYINTAGVGVIPEGVDIRPSRATAGDVVIVSGPIGMHGVAVMSQLKAPTITSWSLQGKGRSQRPPGPRAQSAGRPSKSPISDTRARPPAGCVAKRSSFSR
jgi:hydrogenase expression/formation protein HypE